MFTPYGRRVAWEVSRAGSVVVRESRHRGNYMWFNAHNAADLFVIAKLPIPLCAVVKVTNE